MMTNLEAIIDRISPEFRRIEIPEKGVFFH